MAGELTVDRRTVLNASIAVSAAAIGLPLLADPTEAKIPKRMNHDLDGDGETEEIHFSCQLDPPNVITNSTDGDGDADIVIVGVDCEAVHRVRSGNPMRAPPSERDILIFTCRLPHAQTQTKSIDGDGDADIFWVGADEKHCKDDDSGGGEEPGEGQ